MSFKTPIVLFVSLLFAVSGASAGIIVDQPPDRGGGPAADTDYFSISFNGPFWQLEADNVQVSAPAVVRRIGWWGFYGDDFDESPNAHDPPSGDETMRIRFYSARPGDSLPDSSNILFQQSFLNPSRTATGFTIAVGGRPLEYKYETYLGSPVRLEPGLLYWLEIVQEGDQSSLFRWERGTGIIPGRAFLNPSVDDWRGISGSFAFELSTIPEPSSAALLFLGSLTIAGRRWRRRVSRA